WQPDSHCEPERLFGEVYSADIFNQEHEKIRVQNLSGPTPHIETVLCSLLLYSDSTHLTNFGNAQLWPIYMYIGNISKYLRSIPSKSNAYHLAYIPKVRANSYLITSAGVNMSLVDR
ncbi:MAG TPA: hypothetical protein VGO47_05205, partial [Chlamydiales bacterium]|nr:hypothetical protein [Chlamydiales bacterium]